MFGTSSRPQSKPAAWLTLALLAALSPALFAQAGGSPITPSAKDALAKSAALVSQRQYESAYRLLDQADPANQDPSVVVAKLRILLQDSVTTDKDRSFTLADLKEGQALADLVPSAASLTRISFDAEKVLGGLIARNPANGVLRQALGEFYLDARLRYGDSWEKDAKTLVALALANFKKAQELGDTDPVVNARLGLLYLVDREYAKSIDSYQRAFEAQGTKLDTDDVYNVAYAYLLSGDTANALRYAQAAADGYKEPSEKADALRLVAEIYGKAGDDAKAVAVYRQVLGVAPDDTLSLEHLIDLYLKQGDLATASATSVKLFGLFPTNPDSPQFLTQVYLAHQQSGELLTLFKSLEGSYKGNDAAVGNVQYYEGLLLAREGKRDDAVAQLQAAKGHLQAAYPGNTKLFDQIDRVIEDINKGQTGQTSP